MGERNAKQIWKGQEEGEKERVPSTKNLVEHLFKELRHGESFINRNGSGVLKITRRYCHFTVIRNVEILVSKVINYKLIYTK